MTDEQLFETYQHLAKTTLHRIFHDPVSVAQSKGMEYDDLLQLARIGLWKGVTDFKTVNHSSTIKNFIIRNVRWYVMHKLTRATVHLRIYKSQKDSEENTISLISLSNTPYIDEDTEITYYDIVSSDGITDTNSHDLLPEEIMLSIEKEKEIMELLNKKEKELLQMKLKNLSVEEIGRNLNLSKKGVYYRLSRLKNRLEEVMEVV